MSHPTNSGTSANHKTSPLGKQIGICLAYSPTGVSNWSHPAPHTARGWTHSGCSGEGGGQDCKGIRRQRKWHAPTGSLCINEVAAMLVAFFYPQAVTWAG